MRDCPSHGTDRPQTQYHRPLANKELLDQSVDLKPSSDDKTSDPKIDLRKLPPSCASIDCAQKPPLEVGTPTICFAKDQKAMSKSIGRKSADILNTHKISR